MFEYYGNLHTIQPEPQRVRSQRAMEEYELRRALNELEDKRRAERRARRSRYTRRLPRPALKWLA